MHASPDRTLRLDSPSQTLQLELSIAQTDVRFIRTLRHKYATFTRTTATSNPITSENVNPCDHCQHPARANQRVLYSVAECRRSTYFHTLEPSHHSLHEKYRCYAQRMLLCDAYHAPVWYTHSRYYMRRQCRLASHTYTHAHTHTYTCTHTHKHTARRSNHTGNSLRNCYD